MLLLETELPDELMQGGSSWEQQMVTNKPPAQGPGPGQQQQMYNSQMNGGEESIVPANVAATLQQRQQQQQQHQQQLAHLLQQGQKNPMVNPHLNQLNKNPIQGGGGGNATVMNNLVNMPMSMAPSNNGTNANMPMQGRKNLQKEKNN